MAHPEMVAPDGKIFHGYSYNRSLEVFDGIAVYCPTYMFEEEWEMNSGKWVFSVIYSGMQLLEFSFTAYVP